ncbi:MAG TPA: response regulator transcription factor [Pyrinomonadaceae bacterium]|nr:response regulator transcription factor [Acidobacteriota bacterium]HMM78829.1 response regulator transcription factor [Pyrinomonadaceae bacterium]
MRILLIEDDNRIAAFVAKGLRENSYAVDLASDGDEATYLASINTYDLFILDVNLPRKDGFEVCRELREGGNSKPILLLTARDAIDDKVSGLDVGADDYLTKPFEFRELLARLRALLRRQNDIRSPEITIADLHIDTMSRTVKRGECLIELTTKEYSLIEFLAINKGKVVGREEISEHVWDDTFDPFSNLIEVYINRLRAKLDDGFDMQLIQTRRGSGYILNDV